MTLMPSSLTTSAIYDSPGERLKAIRSLVRLSRQAFESHTGISQHSLRAWEADINPLNEKTAVRLASIFEGLGFSCSPEWLLAGIGPSPLAPAHHHPNDSKLRAILQFNNELAIQKEIQIFKENAQYPAIIT